LFILTLIFSYAYKQTARKDCTMQAATPNLTRHDSPCRGAPSYTKGIYTTGPAAEQVDRVAFESGIMPQHPVSNLSTLPLQASPALWSAAARIIKVAARSNREGDAILPHVVSFLDDDLAERDHHPHRPAWHPAGATNHLHPSCLPSFRFNDGEGPGSRDGSSWIA